MTSKKSRKRTFAEAKEFMPLSKGKLFESDSDNDCEYDWGFKKPAANLDKKNEIKLSKTVKKDDIIEIIGKKFAYRSADPLKLKDEDKQVYMENLSKIYERSFVYIPTFYDVDDVVLNMKKMINQSIRAMFQTEIQSLTEVVDNFWEPLNDHYVKTGRLPSDCSASRMITRCLQQCLQSKSVFQGCMEDFEAHASQYRQMIDLARNKDIDSITAIFRDAVGSVLLRYISEPDVPLDQMVAGDTNRSVFMRMVADNIDTVKQRVKSRAKVESMDDIEEGNTEEEQETQPIKERPAPKNVLDNRGIVPRRKRPDANPRVKHRMKFKKAVRKHHSQVPRTRDDGANYEGEQTGIRIGMVKSRKIK